MIKIKNLKELSADDFNKLFNRFGEDLSDTLHDIVIPIINDVRDNGDQAVKKYTEKFDKVKLDSLLVSEDEIDEG